LEADFQRYYSMHLGAALWDPRESVTPRRIEALVQGLARYPDSALVASLQRAQEPVQETRSLDDIERESPHLFIVPDNASG